MNEDIEITNADITDLDKILSIMISIDNKRNNIIKYNDFEFKHSKESLEKVLNNENKDEIIFIAIYNENLIGILNILFSNPDYNFFADKFIYIKYLYIENNESIKTENRRYISEKLFGFAINKAKEYGFKYICGDVLDDEDELKELFKINSMENYRNRLYKRISDIS
jgi:hypothetical protein